MISRTEDWMSGSVILLMCPFLTISNQYKTLAFFTVGVEELERFASVEGLVVRKGRWRTRWSRGGTGILIGRCS